VPMPPACPAVLHARRYKRTPFPYRCHGLAPWFFTFPADTTPSDPQFCTANVRFLVLLQRLLLPRMKQGLNTDIRSCSTRQIRVPSVALYALFLVLPARRGCGSAARNSGRVARPRPTGWAWRTSRDDAKTKKLRAFVPSCENPKTPPPAT
jgi:hypothetical protein